MKITISQEDIEKAGIQFSKTGQLIDELAYSAGEWTSEELLLNNLDYEPRIPYSYNYEADLFERTKTIEGVESIIELLDFTLDEPECLKYQNGLQAGASIALNYPEIWEKLLLAYTEKLEEEYTDGISDDYNEALQKERYAYHDEQYKNWLYGDRDYMGVVREVAKFFTDEGEGEYDEKAEEYTFILNECDIEEWKDRGFENEDEIKRGILFDIKDSSESRKAKDMKAREERKAERERLTAYKAEQAKEEAEARKAKLLSMKLNK